MDNQKCVSMVILKPAVNADKALHSMRKVKCAIWCRKECEFRVVGRLKIEKADVILRD